MLYVLRDGKPIECKSEEFEYEEEFKKIFLNLIKEYPEILIPMREPDEQPSFLFLIDELSTLAGNIDLFGVDNEYFIYIIETKLYRNTERRRAISQALDYVASVWSKSVEEAEKTINKIEERLGEKLEAEVREKIVKSLMNGYFKVILAFDKIDNSLKKVIDFLNEFSEFDIYAVELQKIVGVAGEDKTMVISYTMYPSSEPRATRPSRKRRVWNEQAFFDEIKQKFDDTQVNAIRKLYEQSKELFGEENMHWGQGRTLGTLKIRLPEVFGDKDVYGIDTDGKVWIMFANMYEASNEQGIELSGIIDKLAETLYSNNFLDRQVNRHNYKEKGKQYPSIRPEQWMNRIDELIEIIKEFREEIRKAHNSKENPVL